MRKVISLGIGLVIGGLLLGSGVSLSEQAKENLVKNHSFEQVDAQGMPKGWIAWPGNEGAKYWQPGIYFSSSDDAHSGKNSAYIKLEDCKRGVQWQRNLKLSPDTTYTASACIETKDLQPGGRVLYIGMYVGTLELAKQGKLKSHSKHGPRIKGTTDWTYYKLTFTLPRSRCIGVTFFLLS
ncbi:MAG: carbohydrate binding domain-containing protein [Candidatus Omnitrophica bacterium]|nr:carbohydrate binding domain-containing protein [Candidatus Omnitrophota bacterium]